MEAKASKWNKLKRKVQEDAEQAQKKVKLDVGGKIFCISKPHLLSVEGSYFHAMLGSGQWNPDSDGAYFIDRDPRHFERVLDYLRTGKISFTGLRSDQINLLTETLDYMQLGNARPSVVWDPQMRGSELRLSEGNLVVSSWRYESHFWGQSIRSLYTCVRYSVRLDATEDYPSVLIGFASEAGFHTGDSNYSHSGWYLKAYEHRISAGSVVTCIFNQVTGNISFEVDGESNGVSYSNLTKVEVYATVIFYGEDIHVTLVEENKLK